MSRNAARELPMQDRWGAATWPSRMISSTVSSVPCCVEPPAPNVTEKYFGCSSASLARVTRSFSVPSGVFGGKNSMLKLCGVMESQTVKKYTASALKMRRKNTVQLLASGFQQQRGQGPGDDAVQQRATDRRPETTDMKAAYQLRHYPEHQAVDDEDEQAQRQQRHRQGEHHQHRPHQRVDETENQRGNQGGAKAVDLHRMQKIRHGQQGQRIDQPENEQTHEVSFQAAHRPDGNQASGG